eukprot:TRINITY_DN11449_c0_g1_i19.p1 TRINITY_DN11449_c0_g1~~TRINITY_DN11449_c0_g1_i19.p1  ORF type:complete len:355 (+),score=94.07 TRINITY_DN11449_c0_g1_i19:384-1448(+)
MVKERQDLQKQYETERSTENKSGKAGKDKGNMLGLPTFGITNLMGFNKNEQNEEVKKMEGEVTFLKKQYEGVQRELTKALSENENLKKESEQKQDELKKKIEKLQEELKQKDLSVKNYMAEIKNLYQANSNFLSEREELHKKLETVEALQKELENEKIIMRTTLDERGKRLEVLTEELKKKENDNEQLAAKVVQLKKELGESEMKMQIFNVTKIAKMINSPAQILSRVDVNGDYLIQIEGPAERAVVHAADIVSLSSVKEAANRFQIQFKIKQNQVETAVFESEETAKILKTMKYFLQKAQEENKQKKNTDSKKDKSTISEIISFFGNQKTPSMRSHHDADFLGLKSYIIFNNK